jgi:hypothetical protein
VEAPLEDAKLLVSDRFILVGALCGLRQSLPRDAFRWTVGMFDDVVHIDLCEDPEMRRLRHTLLELE